MLIQHHIKYKEIHGVDEVVWMERGEHKHLHSELRKQGKCNVPVDKLYEIASKAHNRTERHKENRRVWRRKPENVKKDIEYSKIYIKKYIKRFCFSTGLGICGHLEYISYNVKTGNVQVTCRFRANRQHKIYEIKEKNPAPVVADKPLDIGLGD